MLFQILEFITLILLLLITGVFWGPWLGLHRTLHLLTSTELIRLVKILSKNLAMPMQILMPLCLVFMLLSIIFYPNQDSFGFYGLVAAFIFSLSSLIITMVVEVPIVKQIQEWTEETVPANWEAIRNKWVKFHVLRICTSIASFGFYLAAILNII